VRARAGVGRAILVVEAEPYLWAALQDRLCRATAYVRSAAPDEVRAVWETCRPWPWIVVGTLPDLPQDLAALLSARPVPVHWLGPPPAGLPRAATAHQTWLELLTHLVRLDDLTLSGVRLLRNRGLVAPDGRVVLDVPELEGLLAAPDGLPVDPRAVDAELAAARLPFLIDQRAGNVRLEAAT
jgi:hypothetical protein